MVKGAGVAASAGGSSDDDVVAEYNSAVGAVSSGAAGAYGTCAAVVYEY